MELRCFSFTLLLLIFSGKSYSGIAPAGSRAGGLAGVSAVSGDLFTCFNNPAGLSMVDGFSVGTFYESRFLLPGTFGKGVAFALKAGNIGSLGFSLKEFGNNNLRDRSVGATFSKSFGHKVHAGLRVNYLSTVFSGDYRPADALVPTLGMVVSLNTRASLGVCITNPGKVKYSGTEEPAQALMMAGLRWRVSGYADFFIEAEKSAGLPYIIRSAVEYRTSGAFVLRAGASNSYLPFSFGAGFLVGKATIDIAAAYHFSLGITPSVSLVWSNSKQHKK